MKQRILSVLAVLAFGWPLLAFTPARTPVAAGAISGFVWDDLNTNGIQEPGEPGHSDVWVFLLNPSGATLAVTLTDTSGKYAFPSIPAGQYSLRFANPGGLWQTLLDQGNDDTKDNDADPFGYTASFSLADGQSLDLDAGFTTVAQGCFTPITATVSAIDCDDHGTADPSDDTFTFALTATGGTGPWGWDMLPDLSMIPYGTTHTFGPFQIVNGAVTVTINDHDNPACTATVTVTPPAPCSSPLPPPSGNCDEKIIGCIKYELLDITLDSEKNRTYRIRVTNNCANPMIYTAFQLPDGAVAMAPTDNSIFTAPSGREYAVRNPNFSPFYSIRFKSQTDSISNGESDIFSYTLPAQSAPDYIHVIVRIYPKVFYETHLNTSDCVPIITFKAPNSTEVSPSEAAAPGETVGTAPLTRQAPTESPKIYPNPTEGSLFADLSAWKGQSVMVSVLNSQGGAVTTQATEAGDQPFPVEITGSLPNGLYFLEVIPAEGAPKIKQFILQR